MFEDPPAVASGDVVVPFELAGFRITAPSASTQKDTIHTANLWQDIQNLIN